MSLFLVRKRALEVGIYSKHAFSCIKFLKYLKKLPKLHKIKKDTSEFFEFCESYTTQLSYLRFFFRIKTQTEKNNIYLFFPLVFHFALQLQHLQKLHCPLLHQTHHLLPHHQILRSLLHLHFLLIRHFPLNPHFPRCLLHRHHHCHLHCHRYHFQLCQVQQLFDQIGEVLEIQIIDV